MSVLALDALGKFLALCARSLWPPRASAARRTLGRVMLMLVFLPLFGILQLLHWIGFALDEVFYRGYRRVEVRAPVFVTGVPRSGTTMLHRTLSDDAQYTTMTTWECLFAPSVTERKIVRGAAALDALLGAPLARAIGWLERKAFAGLADVHGMSLGDAEEDYFVFMPLLRCFILIVPFPYAGWIWDMGQFDARVPARSRERIMRYYANCVRRHLYVHGTDKRYLSKNASFPPLLGSLVATFPDARFVYCVRDPLEVVPSQLSSLREGMALFGNDPYDAGFRDRLIAQLVHYYEQLIDAPVPQAQFQRVAMNQLKADVSATVRSVYANLSLPLSPEFDAALTQHARTARAYQSRHRYALDEYGLDATRLRQQFRRAYEELDFLRAPDATPTRQVS